MIWNNIISAPNRWMAYWLRRRGWVCFYLDEEARACRGGTCWMAIYREEVSADAAQGTR